ncbi:Uncharacterised protein [Mycobacteroides abscessus]|nr:Uncharacterised protein [Mycobacteroides abscessus]
MPPPNLKIVGTKGRGFAPLNHAFLGTFADLLKGGPARADAWTIVAAAFAPAKGAKLTSAGSGRCRSGQAARRLIDADAHRLGHDSGRQPPRLAGEARRNQSFRGDGTG